MIWRTIIFVLSLCTSLYSQDDLDYIENGRAFFYKYLEDNTNLDSCVYYFKTGLQHHSNIEDWEKAVLCANGLSSVFWINENFKESKKYAVEAHRLSKEKIGKDKEAYRNSLHNLSAFSRSKGNYEESINLLKEIISIEKNIVDNNVDKNINLYKRYIISLINLGDSHFILGDFFESLRHYKSALRNSEKYLPADNIRITESYLKLAEVATAMSQDSLAFSYLINAKDKVEVFKFSNVHDYNLQKEQIHFQLAKFYFDKNEETLFKSSIKKAIKYGELAVGNSSVQAGYILLGEWYLKTKDYQKAFDYFDTARRGIEKKYEDFDFHPSQATALSNIGKSLVAQGKYENALQQFHLALKQFSNELDLSNSLASTSIEKLIVSPNVLLVLLEKGNCLHELYEQSKEEKYLEAELKHYDLAVLVLNKLRQQYLDHGSKEIITSNATRLFDAYMLAAHSHYTLNQEPESFERILKIAENSKAIILLESMNELSALGVGGIPDSLIQQEKELKVELTFLEGRLIDVNASEESRRQLLEKQIYDLKDKSGDLKNMFEEKYPKYFNTKYNTELASVIPIQKKLGKSNISIIEYFVAEDHIYLIFISKSKTKVEKIDFTPELLSAIKTIGKQINIPPSSKNAEKNFFDFVNASHLLHNALIDPVTKGEKIEELLIIPDDLLSFIPFEILLSNQGDLKSINYSSKNLDYLIEDYAISYDYSATLFLQQKTISKNLTKDFIGFAPVFGKRDGLSMRSCQDDLLSDLKCNIEEVENINKIIKGDSYVDANASKQVFVEDVKNYKIIHLATHACVDEINPKNNKIYFSEDYLSSHDLFNLEINAELSVLSACNTGDGALVKGEGVMSLSRGFIQAGCKSVLMSLWSVEDCSTSDIMENYYSYLQKGEKKNKALQSAKLDFIKNSTKLSSHPFYWAPFVQIGNIDSISFSSSLGYSFYIGIALTLLFIVYFFYNKKQKLD